MLKSGSKIIVKIYSRLELLVQEQYESKIAVVYKFRKKAFKKSGSYLIKTCDGSKAAAIPCSYPSFEDLRRKLENGETLSGKEF